MRLFSPPALLARIEATAGALPLLAGGPSDAPARHQTLRAAIAWSYDLLTPQEQTLLRRLSVFAGGFGLSAAEAVGGDGVEGEGEGDGGAVVEALEGLVTKSLVRRAPGRAPRQGVRRGRDGCPQLAAPAEEHPPDPATRCWRRCASSRPCAWRRAERRTPSASATRPALPPSRPAPRPTTPGG